MALDLLQVVNVITALTSFTTVLGGTYIAIKQSNIAKKIDDAKTAANIAAQIVTENAETRNRQISDLKETVIAKVEEIKRNGKPP